MNSRRGLWSLVALVVAACTPLAPAPEFSVPRPEYDGPTGDPGFPVPDWMAQNYCMQGTGFDFCQGYTIEEQRRMMILYQRFLGGMVDAECEDLHLKFDVKQAKEWWPNESQPPFTLAIDFELIDRARSSAYDRYQELRSEHSDDAFCRVASKEPELNGVLGPCVTESDGARVCY